MFIEQGRFRPPARSIKFDNEPLFVHLLQFKHPVDITGQRAKHIGAAHPEGLLRKSKDHIRTQAGKRIVFLFFGNFHEFQLSSLVHRWHFPLRMIRTKPVFKPLQQHYHTIKTTRTAA